MLSAVIDLYSYNRWANGRIMDAVAPLDREERLRDLGNSFPSIQETVVHIVGAEWIWLRRWQGESPRRMPEEWNVREYDAMRSTWDGVAAEQAEFLGGLDEGDLQRVLTYRNTAGAPFEAPLWQLLFHVVNHSTYHRGQVTTMLRQLGRTPATTDLVAYHRERDRG